MAGRAGEGMAGKGMAGGEGAERTSFTTSTGMQKRKGRNRLGHAGRRGSAVAKARQVWKQACR